MTTGPRLIRAAVPPVLYMGLIFVLSSRPAPEAVVALGVSDLWLHVAEYAVLGFLLARFASVATGGTGFVATVLLPAVAGALYGASDELHQALVPTRDASSADLAMDAIGSLLGALTHAAFRRLRK